MINRTNLLVTGGAGFIGSHTCLSLIEAGHRVVVLDNFSNSSKESLHRVQSLAKTKATAALHIVKGDIAMETLQRYRADVSRLMELAKKQSSGVPIDKAIKIGKH